MYILCLSCNDKPGIVAAVATALSDAQCNIEESSQFNDIFSGQFFMRVVLSPLKDGYIASFKERFSDIAESFAMRWSIFDVSQKTKTLIMVSKFDHCLNDILYKWKNNSLPIEITAVASNHQDIKELVENHNLPFHHYPITKETKHAQEQQVRALIQETQSELIIMARYMQILTEEFCGDYTGRVINIHHSFLPGFKGAKPYTQAYERGVKIIGATAHFATSDLDEGPIISQNITPVTHANTPEKMQLMGQDTECRALAHAIMLYAERRIFLHAGRTIIL